MNKFNKLRGILLKLRSEEKLDCDMYDLLSKCVDDLELEERRKKTEVDDGK